VTGVQTCALPIYATPAAPAVARIIRMREAAARLGVSIRTIDNLAKSGFLHKRTFPGRKRASGFPEGDISALITGQGV
jgi:predicted DNA-binding transcriptional regulator AlpA